MSDRLKEIDIHCFYPSLGPTNIYYPVGLKNPKSTDDTSGVGTSGEFLNGDNTRKRILPVEVAMDQQGEKYLATNRRKLRQVITFDILIVDNKPIGLFLTAKCIGVYLTSGLIEVCLFEFLELRHSFRRFDLLVESSLPFLV